MCFMMLTLSPVRIDWSILSVVEWTVVKRMSAGILSPTEGCVMKDVINLMREGGKDGERGRE